MEIGKYTYIHLYVSIMTFDQREVFHFAHRSIQCCQVVGNDKVMILEYQVNFTPNILILLYNVRSSIIIVFLGREGLTSILDILIPIPVPVE